MSLDVAAGRARLVADGGAARAPPAAVDRGARHRRAERRGAPATGLAAQPWRVLEKLGAGRGRRGPARAARREGRALARAGPRRRRDDGGRTGGAGSASGSPTRRSGWPAGGLRLKPASADATLALDERPARRRARRGSWPASPRSTSRGRLDRISPITATASRPAPRSTATSSTPSRRAPSVDGPGRGRRDGRGEGRPRRRARSPSPRRRSPSMGVGPVGGERPRAHRGPAARARVADRGEGLRRSARRPRARSRSLSTAKTDVAGAGRGDRRRRSRRAFSSADVPVAARADGSLRWATTGWDVDAAKGTGEIALRPSPRAPGRRPRRASRSPAPGACGSRGAPSRSRALTVEARGARLTADAALAPKARLRGSWSATLPLASVDALLADLGSEARLPEGYTGTLVAEGELAGPASSPETSAPPCGARASPAHGRPHSLEAQARYAARPARARAADGPLRPGDRRRSPARSRSSRTPASGTCGARSRRWTSRRSLALAGIEGDGPATGTLRVEGPRDAPRGRADLDARVVLAEDGETAGEPMAVALAASSDGGRVRGGAPHRRDGRRPARGLGPATTRRRARSRRRRSASGLAWARLPLLPESLRRLGGTLAADVVARGHDRSALGRGARDARRARPSTARRCPRSPSTRARTADGSRSAAAPARPSFLKGAGDARGRLARRLEIDVAALPAQALLDAVTAGRLPRRDARGAGDGRPRRRAARRRAAALHRGGARGERTRAAPRVEHRALPARGHRRGGERRRPAPDDARDRATRAAARADAAEEGRGGARPAPAGGVLTVDGRVPLAEGRTFDLA